MTTLLKMGLIGCLCLAFGGCKTSLPAVKYYTLRGDKVSSLVEWECRRIDVRLSADLRAYPKNILHVQADRQVKASLNYALYAPLDDIVERILMTYVCCTGGTQEMTMMITGFYVDESKMPVEAIVSIVREGQEYIAREPITDESDPVIVIDALNRALNRVLKQVL